MSFQKLWIGLPLVAVGAATVAVCEPNTRCFLYTQILGTESISSRDTNLSGMDKSDVGTDDASKTKMEPVGIQQAVDEYLASKKSEATSAQLVSYSQANEQTPTTGLQSQPQTPVSAPAQQPIASSPNVPQTKIPTQGLKVPTASNSVNTGVLRVSPATLKFVNDIDVVAQADGLITNLAVDEGSIGRNGSVLVEIDSRLAESEVKVATKELEAADLKSSDDSNIKFSAATLDVAKWDYTTSLDLFKKGVEGESDHNKKRLEFIKAGFQVDVAKIEKSRDKAAADVARAKLDAASLQVALRKITAPFDGIVVLVEKENHDWVRAGEKILRFVSPERIRIKGNVQLVGDISPNMLQNAPARVEIEIAPGRRVSVDSVVGFVSFSAATSNSYPIWVEITNQVVDGQYLFRDGMNASFEIMPLQNK